MSRQIHYVKSSKRQKGYFRKRPYHYDTPTLAQRKARAILARVAFEKGRDKTGKVQIVKDDVVKEAPASAVPVMEEMKGKPVAVKLAPPPMLVSPYEQLKKFFESIAKTL
ncbi:MAG: hypothetical protein QMD10_11630 [Desulfitobacteriaceae bacterium]|nr:hypothetical protein [Desulfitobacteriaceae bacterium]